MPQALLTTFLIALRYFSIAGAFWLVWYVLLHKRVAHRKIQPGLPSGKDYRREIGYSLITVIIFAAYPILLLQSPLRLYTQFYTSIGAHTRWYFWLAFPLVFLIHDAYFYWSHRLMHHRRLFRTFHLVHHKSTNPSPWAAMAFHPLEALVEAGIFPLLLFMMPMHVWHIFVFFLLMMVYNVYGHLGWDIFPKGFSKHRLGRWINTSFAHNQHHQYFKGNYGLYFLWWDRWMGTLREDYERQYEAGKARTSDGNNSVPDQELSSNPKRDSLASCALLAQRQRSPILL